VLFLYHDKKILKIPKG